MLSSVSRLLTYTCAGLYGVIGLFLFVMPEQLAPVFPWKVTAFMTMTIGGWCLGNSWLAFISARRWEWKLVYTSLLYLWMFGIGELIVLFSFRDKLSLAHPIAVLYVATLAVNGITALIGMRVGTGGTSRAGYLEGALRQHYIFKELTEVSTFLIEHSKLPELPKAVKEKMSFNA